MSGKRKPMTDDELLSLVDGELKLAFGSGTGKHSEKRRRALQFFEGLPVGELAPPGVAGRSTAVSTDVQETVLGVIPKLMKIFTAGDTAVEFAPRQPAAEAMAKQATEYVNYLFYRRNEGFMVLYTQMMDALLYGNGTVKVFWDNALEEAREEYRGLSDVALTMLLQDPKVEMVEHSAYADPQALPGEPVVGPDGVPMLPEVPLLHDVAVKRVLSRGRVRVEAVPPDELLISRQARSVDDTPFVAHQFQRTIGQLRAAGYRGVSDDLAAADYASFSSERIERQVWDDDFGQMSYTDALQGGGDPSSRLVWVQECYLQVDVDGDGIAEWRKVVRVGSTLLGDPDSGETSVAVEGTPFADLKPVLMPHRYHGMSLAELAMPSQRERTAIKRATLDDLYLRVNGRTWAVKDQVNLDDLLTNRPGGVVRVNAPGMVGPLQQGLGDQAAAMTMLEYSLTERENRTGFTRYSQGQNADSLNQTATGINIITNRSDERIELIARCFAETGIKQLFVKMLRLVCEHQDEPESVQLASGFAEVDPREWDNQFDFVINVGLGTGNKDQILQHVSMLIQQLVQPVPLQMGLVKPENLHEAFATLIDALGFGKSVDRLLSDPAKNPPAPPPPPPPDPKIMLEQQKLAMQHDLNMATVQREHEKAEADIALRRMELELRYPQASAGLYPQIYGSVEQEFSEAGPEVLHGA